MSADSVRRCLLEAWVLPEDHQREFSFPAESNPGAVVVALVSLALLLGWKVKGALRHGYPRIPLALAEGAAHWFRQQPTVVLGAEQGAPGFGVVG